MSTPVKIMLAALLLAVGAIAFCAQGLLSAKSSHAAIEKSYRDLQSLSTETMALNDRVGSLESRRARSAGSDVITSINDITTKLEIREKVTSVERTPGMTDPMDDRAEVSCELLSLNELVNLLHAIEGFPRLLVIRKMKVATAFEDPEKLNLSLTVSLIRPARQP